MVVLNSVTSTPIMYSDSTDLCGHTGEASSRREKPVQASLLEPATHSLEVLEERRREARGGGAGAKGVGDGEGARPLPPRISAGHKRGGATLLLCENCPAGPPIFFEPVFLLKEPFSLF